jgi:hypothetical protein
MDDATKRRVLKQINADLAKLDVEKRRLLDFATYVKGEPVEAPAAMAPKPQSPKRPGRRRSHDGGPTLRDRVTVCFGSIPPGTPMTVPEIASCLEANGWDAPTENRLAILRRVLRELSGEGFLTRPDSRTYQVAGVQQTMDVTDVHPIAEFIPRVVGDEGHGG